MIEPPAPPALRRRWSPHAPGTSGSLLAPHLISLASWLLVLTLLLAMLALCGFMWLDDLQEERQDAALQARTFENSITQSLRMTDAKLATLESALRDDVPFGRAHLPDTLRQSLVGLPVLRSLSVLSPSGHVIASSEPDTNGLTVDLGRLQIPAGPGQSFPGAVLPGRELAELAADARPPQTQARMLPMVRRVAAGDKEYLVVAVLNPDAFALIMQTGLVHAQDSAVLVNVSGAVLAATENLAAIQQVGPQHEALQGLLRGQWHGEGVGPGLDGRASITSYRVSPDYPVLVIVQGLHERAVAEWWSIAGWVVVGTVVLIVIILRGSAIIRRALREQGRISAELAQTQMRAAAAGEELTLLVENMQEGLFRADAQGRMSFVNAQLTRWCRQPARALAGQPLWSLLIPHEQASMQALLADPHLLPSTGLMVTLAAGAGSRRALLNLTLLRNAHGEGEGFMGTLTDISDREAAREALQHQLALASRLLEVTPNPIMVQDRERRLTLVNDAWVDFFGIAREDAVGRCAGELQTGPLRGALHEGHDRRLLDEGGRLRQEFEWLRPDGQQIHLLISKAAILDDEGCPIGIVGAITDITQFKEAERAVGQARDAAEATSRLKTEFIANISHELRTPLQLILGYSELGVARTDASSRSAAMFGDIHKAGQGMLTLVNDLLDLSKMEAAIDGLDGRMEDAVGLTTGMVGEMDSLAAARGVQLQAQGLATPRLLRLDAFRFQQVVRNVLSNAIRFSPSGGVVALQWADDPYHGWRLSILDEGPGIPPDELESIFDAFIQSSRTKSAAGGTGLGLAICRKIMAAHGGRISAANRPGGGAVFHIDLPLAA